MTRDEILNSRTALKRFARDFNVPVASYDSEYFLEQLKTLSLYSSHYIELFEEFVKELAAYPSPEAYFEHYNVIKDTAIEYIMTNPEFKAFSCSDINCPKSYIKQEVYKPTNDGKRFISIDLRKANFNIVTKYCPCLFEGKSWEQFLANCGASSYMQRSKYIRQVIFGACNPKKQIQAMTKLMLDVANKLTMHNYSIYSVTTDEILIELDAAESASVNPIVDILQLECADLLDILKVESFMLIANKQGYIKQILSSTDKINANIVFKCVDSDLFCQVIKHYFNLPIAKSDLVFDYKGSVASFLHPIPNPFLCDEDESERLSNEDKS